jgi:hypothetical protein
MDIKTLFNNAENLLNKEVGVVGWVKNCRKQGTGNSFAFIAAL